MHRLLALALVLCASPAAAQLRPLPPAEWYQEGHALTCGVGFYSNLGAGLIGARGTLRSLGDCTISVDLGTARIQLAGVVHRTFTEDSVFAPPAPEVDPDAGPVRRDWGDFVLETLIPINSGGPWVGGLRFGARYPTTDNRIGLDRDKTDIHIAAMTGLRGRKAAGYIELGVGIHGTRTSWREQQDVLLYAGLVEYVLSGARLRLGALGHVYWLHDWTERGNENLGEVRAGVRWGNGTWLDAEAIAGYTAASPSWGLRVRLGRVFGG
jgi:hypothetical protein